MTTISVAPAPRQLTAQDRCDRCGAQALAAFFHPVLELELLMCAHHSRKDNNEGVLATKGFVLTVDNRP